MRKKDDEQIPLYLLVHVYVWIRCTAAQIYANAGDLFISGYISYFYVIPAKIVQHILIIIGKVLFALVENVSQL